MSLREFQRDQMAFASRADWNQKAEGLTGFEQIVEQFQAPYPDARRRKWIEDRLRAWQARRER